MNYDKLFDQNLGGIQVTQNHHSVASEIAAWLRMDSNRNGFIATASGCIQLLQCQCSRLQVNLGVLFNPFFETDDPLWVHPNYSRTVSYFPFRLYGFPWNFRYLCICIPKFPHQFSSMFMFIIRFFRSQSNTWHQADRWPHRSIIRTPLHSNFRMWRN